MRNSHALLYYRADYEMKSLRRSRRVTQKLEELFETCNDVQFVVALSRELERWTERERILLRIPLPAAMKLDEKKARARGVNYLDITPSAPDTINEAQPAGEPAQPKRGPGRPPKQRPIEPQAPEPAGQAPSPS